MKKINWQTHSFDYQYDPKDGRVMRFIAGTTKGVLACTLAVGLKSIKEVKDAYRVAYQSFGR